MAILQSSQLCLCIDIRVSVGNVDSECSNVVIQGFARWMEVFKEGSKKNLCGT